MQGGKLATARCEVSFRKSEAIDIQEENVFVMWASKEHPGLLNWKDPTPDKTAIKAALKSGVHVPGVCITEKYNIQIK